MKVFMAKLILRLLQPNANQLGSLDANGKVKW